jgi:predicted RNA methylase
VHARPGNPVMNWDAAFLCASRLTGPPAQAARLANLAIAHELSAMRPAGEPPKARPGLARQGSRARTWRDSVLRLALSDLPVADADPRLWDRLHEAAAASAASVGGAHGIDRWVEAFQRFGPYRKTRGAYATPLPLADVLARSVLRPPGASRILDPAAGPGNLLLAVQRQLLAGASSRQERRQRTLRLYGVEIDPGARELACLLLWIGCVGDACLADIAARIVTDNALTRNWCEEEPFDAVIMNPPWESLRHTRQDEVLDLQRKAALDRLRVATPGADLLPALFTRQGRGDPNLYKMFVELAPHLLAGHGRLALLMPAAFASDMGTSQLRAFYFAEMRIERWTSFENLSQYFSIDSRYKFAVMQAVRDRSGTGVLQVRSFAALAAEVEAPHVRVNRRQRALLGGPNGMIPEIVSRRELEVVGQMLRCGVPLLGAGSPFGRVSYRREVDLTLDRKRARFARLDDCDLRQVMAGGRYTVARGGSLERLVPLIEGRMISHYDFFAKSWVAGRGRIAQWTSADHKHLQECRPQFLIGPLGEPDHVRVALCDVTSATNTRTVMASWVPATWQCGNTAPTLRFGSARLALAATAVLNSMTFDWLARRVVSGLHLNKFYLESLAWPVLTNKQIDTLAERSLALLSANPRFTDLGAAGYGPPAVSQKGAANDHVGSHTAIEEVVALGFGLTRAMLGEVFSDRPADRRGLWRHFAIDPRAQAIRAAVIEGYRPGPGVLSRLA